MLFGVQTLGVRYWAYRYVGSMRRNVAAEDQAEHTIRGVVPKQFRGLTDPRHKGKRPLERPAAAERGGLAGGPVVPVLEPARLVLGLPHRFAVGFGLLDVVMVEVVIMIVSIAMVVVVAMAVIVAIAQ